jgi:predicted nucleotidyltransferase
MGQSVSSNSADALKEIVEQRDIPEVSLTGDQIKTMLSLVAERLDKKGANITIVAVGGAVNTILLHSRESTGDVDFFYNTKQRNEDVSAILQAAKEVATDRGLGDAWLNNHTVLFMAVGRDMTSRTA